MLWFFFFFLLFSLFSNLVLLGVVVDVYNAMLYSGDPNSVFSLCFTEKHSSSLTGA